MIAVLLFLVPLISGILLFATKNAQQAKMLSLLAAIATLVVSLLGLTALKQPAYLEFDVAWLTGINSRFHLKLDGIGQLVCLLTAISFPLIILSAWSNEYSKPNNFFGLLLLSQAGLMGVFLSVDLLLFYFFWELALIPVYFLCSGWGGEKRIAVTFKFFIYTFVGSLIMLVGIIALYFQCNETFDLKIILSQKIDPQVQNWLFWFFFVAFAIKMPVWPFHTWQPDTYEQSPTPVTMVLSGIMVKMGLFAVIRWVAPVFSSAFYQWGDTISLLCIVGMLYASVVAIKQDDLKRLIAYSSIAHIGLMCLALFASNKSGMQGAVLQMFVHGINIIGLWIVANTIEQNYGTRKISELGGLAQQAPTLTIMLVIIALANIALPLTNAFVGEFMMFNGMLSSKITRYNELDTVLAGLCIILAAVYTLNMIKQVFYGTVKREAVGNNAFTMPVKLALTVIIVLILVMGVYPKPFLDLTNEAVDAVLNRMITVK